MNELTQQLVDKFSDCLVAKLPDGWMLCPIKQKKTDMFEVLIVDNNIGAWVSTTIPRSIMHDPVELDFEFLINNVRRGIDKLQWEKQRESEK